MTTPERSVEEIVKKFNNDMALQLNPSNDTMKAVRLAHKMVIELLQAERQKREQELQKAHHNWLRDEIVKLEGMQVEPEFYQPVSLGLIGKDYINGSNEALQTIIDRYQSELDQPITSE